MKPTLYGKIPTQCDPRGPEYGRFVFVANQSGTIDVTKVNCDGEPEYVFNISPSHLIKWAEDNA
jgi:hypothetical protein